MFQIDANSGTPIYRQIVDQIRRLIYSGKLTGGDTIPSVRDVALTHTINPMTVSKAYALAEAEGLLLRHRGKPMKVSNQASSLTTESERLAELESLMRQLTDAAKQLNLKSKQVCEHLKKQWNENND